VQVAIHPEPQQWAEEPFTGAKLTDVRRVARVKKIAETMAVHPGRSLPPLCGRPYAVKATDHLCQHEEATPDHMQAGHRAVVLQEMPQPGVSLF
jgi:Transposase DNA-binding